MGRVRDSYYGWQKQRYRLLAWCYEWIDKNPGEILDVRRVSMSLKIKMVDVVVICESFDDDIALSPYFAIEGLGISEMRPIGDWAVELYEPPQVRGELWVTQGQGSS